MSARRQRLPAVHLVLGLMLALAMALPPNAALAQVQQGATLTILRGQVAIIRPNGTAIQPAPSGSTVDAGDEIRTISKSGALITFFSGTEIEMGEDTILVVQQVSRQGDKIDVSLKQVFGATVNRVQTVVGSGSTYQIEAGGAVALVRGTTFALVGPVTTPAGNIVTIACLDECSPASTFNGCAMMPFTGIGVTVGNGKVESGCHAFQVGRTEGLFEAAHAGVTTMEQTVQGDTNGVPAGRVAAGSKQETDARHDRQRREAQQKDQKSTEGDPPRPPSGPPPPPGARPCNTATQSGGFGVTSTVHDLGRSSGTFAFTYDAVNIADRFEVIYQGTTLLDTGFVSGSATHNLTYSGTSTVITVIVTGSTPSTFWEYLVSCPT